MTSVWSIPRPRFFIHLIYDLFGFDKVNTQGQGCGYMACLDDILIYSRTEKEHLEMLDNAFKQCHSRTQNQIK